MWPFLEGYFAGNDIEQELDALAEDYEPGNPVSDALWDWWLYEYEDEFGSAFGDFPESDEGWG